MQSWVDEIKGKVRISEVIRRYVSNIKISGDRMYIACPFHNEKTPSCVVSDERGTFHCFGCGESGDSISFVQKIEKIDFKESCKKIASWYGINLVSNKFEKKDKNVDVFHKINNWFKENLHNNLQAYKYLKSRNVDLDLIKNFELGWIPSFKEVKSFCKSENIGDFELNEIGFKEGILKAFQNRISFPIFSSKNVIGFGARYIPSHYEGSGSGFDNSSTNLEKKRSFIGAENVKSFSKNDANAFVRPKYINSPETKYFKKSKNFYGLNQIKKFQPIALVEGYMDVITMSKRSGNALACLGTSVSDDHINMLKNFTNEVIICMDGDEAGNKATKRILEKVMCHIDGRLRFYVFRFPENEDPDSFMNSNENGWKKILESKEDFISSVWRLFMIKRDSPEEYYNDFKMLMNLVKKIPDQELRKIYASKWKNIWSKEMYENNSRQESYKNSYGGYNSGKRSKYDKSEFSSGLKNKTAPNLGLVYEKALISIVLRFPEVFDHIEEEFLDVAFSNEMKIMKESIIDWIRGGKDVDFFTKKGLDSVVDDCVSDKITQILPFMNYKQFDEKIIESWRFIYKQMKARNK
ncbi:DNA primase [Candidatus Nesciobacter abundans]|uniref:Toprim domain-containing protein n=1 Tax=Candidatus Nesciobacter abundans TaxID=2601668 RepID=A0A5C0UGU3_9PROT|nr:CHC2 zinc finger domain-containing protein [Candidatus Nesciobacter abundans]QEK38950.1 toprim domain-containing protein [Candidatus Nesciobacter abundans]